MKKYSYRLKSSDDYGRHTLRDYGGYDVFLYIGPSAGVHPTRLPNDYVGKHRKDS